MHHRARGEALEIDFTEVFNPIDLGEEMRSTAADGHTRKSTSRRIDGQRIAREHADRFRLDLRGAQGRGKRGKPGIAGHDPENIQSQAGTASFEQARQAVCINPCVGRIDHEVKLRGCQFAQTGQKTLHVLQIAWHQPYSHPQRASLVDHHQSCRPGRVRVGRWQAMQSQVYCLV